MYINKFFFCKEFSMYFVKEKLTNKTNLVSSEKNAS